MADDRIKLPAKLLDDAWASVAAGDGMTAEERAACEAWSPPTPPAGGFLAALRWAWVQGWRARGATGLFKVQPEKKARPKTRPALPITPAIAAPDLRAAEKAYADWFCPLRHDLAEHEPETIASTTWAAAWMAAKAHAAEAVRQEIEAARPGTNSSDINPLMPRTVTAAVQDAYAIGYWAGSVLEEARQAHAAEVPTSTLRKRHGDLAMAIIDIVQTGALGSAKPVLDDRTSGRAWAEALHRKLCERWDLLASNWNRNSVPLDGVALACAEAGYATGRADERAYRQMANAAPRARGAEPAADDPPMKERMDRSVLEEARQALLAGRAPRPGQFVEVAIAAGADPTAVCGLSSRLSLANNRLEDSALETAWARTVDRLGPHQAIPVPSMQEIVQRAFTKLTLDDQREIEAEDEAAAASTRAAEERRERVARQLYESEHGVRPNSPFWLKEGTARREYYRVRADRAIAAGDAYMAVKKQGGGDGQA